MDTQYATFKTNILIIFPPRRQKIYDITSTVYHKSNNANLNGARLDHFSQFTLLFKNRTMDTQYATFKTNILLIFPAPQASDICKAMYSLPKI